MSHVQSSCLSEARSIPRLFCANGYNALESAFSQLSELGSPVFARQTTVGMYCLRI
jgi:hypothetical protein